MGLRAVFFSSSSRRRPSSHTQLNTSVGRGTEMQDEGKTLCFRGCFGGSGDAEVARETSSKENKGKENKPLAKFRRFLKRKSKASSTNVLPADEETNVEEARVPAVSSRDTGAAITSVDIVIGGLEILAADDKRLDMETYKSSPPSFPSTESHTTITPADKEGNHDWMASPILQSFRFSSSGDDGASTPEILLFDDKLDCSSLADTCGTVTCNGKEGSHEATISPILSSSSLTRGSDDGVRTPDILSGIRKLEKEKEETTGYPLDSGSSAETQSTVTSTEEELNRKMRVTLEMLMEMENLLPGDTYDREVEREFGISDCVSGLVSRSPFICWSNRQSRMTVKPSSGSTLFARPGASFPLSPHPFSSGSSVETQSTVTSTDEELNRKMRVTLEMLMEMDNLLLGDTYDREADSELEVRDRLCGLISRSPFVCWSNRHGRMAVEPPFGSTLFEHPDILFPPSPGPLSSPSCSTVTGTDVELDHETTVTLEMLMEMENLVQGGTYDREVGKELRVRDRVSRSVSRSPFVCWSSRQGGKMVEPLSGSTLFALPDALFPPSPCTPSSPSPRSPSSVCFGRSFSADSGDENIWIIPVPGREDTDRTQWTVASTSESGIWESRATVEMLMTLENLLSEETTGRREEIEFGVRDHAPRPVSPSPLVCWSH